MRCVAVSAACGFPFHAVSRSHAAVARAQANTHSTHHQHAHANTNNNPTNVTSDASHLPLESPWPAAFHAHFYALMWCTYRAGFEPIRDLASLSVLPPPLSFSSFASASTITPFHPSLGGHSPTQSDSSYSSVSSSSSSCGHNSSHNAHSSRLSNSSSNSHSSTLNYAYTPGSPTYANNNTSTGYATGTSTSMTSSNTKKKWWPSPSRAPMYVKDGTEPVGGGGGAGGGAGGGGVGRVVENGRARRWQQRLILPGVYPVRAFGVVLRGGPGLIPDPARGDLALFVIACLVSLWAGTASWEHEFSTLPSDGDWTLVGWGSSASSSLRLTRGQSPLHRRCPLCLRFVASCASRLARHAPGRDSPAAHADDGASGGDSADGADTRDGALAEECRASIFLAAPSSTVPFRLVVRRLRLVMAAVELAPLISFLQAVALPNELSVAVVVELVDVLKLKGLVVDLENELMVTIVHRSMSGIPPPALQPLTPRVHALHARLLSWFLDSPSAPFGVHRMALAGKALGKDVGMWFGMSAAAGAVITLVDAFPDCGLGVSVSTDGTLYQTEVYAASHTPAPPALNTHTSHGSNASSASHGSYASSGSHASRPSSSSHGSYPSMTSHHSSASGPMATTKGWGDRPVLLGIRLGLDGVNPVYYETIKMLYTFPQSVGIGRPSSSYYFVGVQGEGFFYLDPHHSRPTIPLRPAPIPYSSTSEPPASQAGSQEPCDARSVSPPMTEEELVLNAQREDDAKAGWRQFGCGRAGAKEDCPRRSQKHSSSMSWKFRWFRGSNQEPLLIAKLLTS
ncbi:hypothetical protein B0H10DRAFT_2196476 [Mycena sp. CBHHK59/15]|nr:hypothetical protein B0H10DRAFT_2196476 [Mycena sp. CBHHK59/15]